LLIESTQKLVKFDKNKITYQLQQLLEQHVQQQQSIRNKKCIYEIEWVRFTASAACCAFAASSSARCLASCSSCSFAKRSSSALCLSSSACLIFACSSSICVSTARHNSWYNWSSSNGVSEAVSSTTTTLEYWE
jgi:hypothetical protein